MRVLNVTAFFEAHRGGIEIVAGRLVRALAEKGVETTWLATATDAPPAELHTVSAPAWNIAERRLGFPWPVIGPIGLGALWRAVGDNEVVVIHDCLYPTSLSAFAIAKMRGKPVVVIQHVGAVPYRNPVLRTLMQFANRVLATPMLAMADQAVFISQVTSAYFRGAPFKSAPQHIFNGVDTTTFRPLSGPAERTRMRRKLGVADDAVVALFVGRFVEKKGLALLRRAAAARPDVCWTFAGWGDEDPESWDLPNVAVFRELSGAGLAELYGASDVLVLPSVGEGFPLVVQEALACGLPVVCGAATVGADPRAAPFLEGVALDSPDPAADLLRALEAALASPTTAEARSAFAAEAYSWSSAAARYVEIFSHLCRRMQDEPEAAKVRGVGP